VIHDPNPAKQVVTGAVIAMTEGPEPFRVCPRCSIRGIAMALRRMLDLAAEADREHGATHGAELRVEVLNILDSERPLMGEEPERPQ